MLNGYVVCLLDREIDVEIEVITTKKKLSKAVIKQLEPASLGDLRQVVSVSKIGYYVRDLGKGYSPRVAVFRGVGHWCVINLRDWEAVGDKPMAQAKALGGRGFSIKKFPSVEQRDVWLSAYNDMKRLCSKNHLIL